jgi:hypothetical protein
MLQMQVTQKPIDIAILGPPVDIKIRTKMKRTKKM